MAAALNRPSQSVEQRRLTRRDTERGMDRRDGEEDKEERETECACVRVRVVLSWRARNHLTSVMDAGCRVKLSAVANGPVIATALHSPRCLQLKGSKNKTGRRPKIETPN